MTEEDQQLVARAVLHGARFRRINCGFWMVPIEGKSVHGRWTIGRAAMDYLVAFNLIDAATNVEYMRRTFRHRPEEVDYEVLEQQMREALSNG